MRLGILWLFLMVPIFFLRAQTTGQLSWQEVWQQVMTPEDDEEGAYSEDQYELLQELSEHPIDLNRASREELERLPFLSDQQVMDFIEYRDRYGVLRSMGEIRMVRSMSYQQIELLPFFTYIGEVADSTSYPNLSTMLSNGRHELSASVGIPLYKRKGDENGYLGYRYRHWARYEFSYGNYLRLGMLGNQDAGEPFFSGENRWGYDVYSYYLQIKKLGCLDNLVIGKYKVATGMGLVLNSSFSLGKLAALQSLGRQSSTLRPHASRSEADYMQGVAAVVSLSKHLRLTSFASYRLLDATLNPDGTAATLVTAGYHRTPAEMAKKYNTQQADAGADITYRQGGLSIGATAVYTHLDRRLKPNTSSLFRHYYACGNNFLNTGLHYGFVHHRFSVNGETAVNQDGALATINTASFLASPSWSIVALQRFYSYRYSGLHAHAFSEGGRVQNESGFYLGTTWQPFTRLLLRGYADFASFPWARYRVSRSSTAQDYLGEAVFTPKRNWTLTGRYRLHQRWLDNEAKSGLRRHNEHRARLALSYNNDKWSATSQIDGVRAVNEETEHGWMLSQQLSWKHGGWQLAASAAYFDTDSYDSRIYAYERQLPHNFAFPMYYGRGYRLALVARSTIGRKLQIDGKIGATHYNDRTTISSGLQEISGSTMTDVSLQMRWRF